MRHMLLIECGTPGVLFVNGQFCGPMEPEGQAFPCSADAEIYVQLFPFGECAPLTAKMRLCAGKIALLEPRESCFALLWPGGVIQLELRMGEQTAQREDGGAMNALLRYLVMRLDDHPQAQLLLMQPQAGEVDLTGYHAAVPLLFSPGEGNERFDQRAGLVRREAENIACVDLAMAITSPAGQGRRLIERIEIVRT